MHHRFIIQANTCVASIWCMQLTTITLIPGPCKRKQLKKDAVPSIFSWTTKHVSNRSTRLERRQKASGVPDQHSQDPQPQEHDVALEVEVETNSVGDEGDGSTHAQELISSLVDSATQTNVVSSILDVDACIESPQKIKALTGFDDYEHFKFVLAVVRPSDELGGSCRLSTEQQFLMILMKLRHNITDNILAILFGICRTAVGQLFHSWVKFMYRRFACIEIWPEKGIVPPGEPIVIIDCTECKLQVPLNPVQQQASYSNYKKDNTYKVLVGISHNGAVVFCSDAYGGSISDREIFERCGIMQKLKPGDIVMADRGFNVQDLLALKDVRLVTPEYMKNRSQLPSRAIAASRKVTAKRIHVERLIGLTKCFGLLRSPLHRSRVPIASEIVYVCAFMCNLKGRIVS